MTNETMEKQPEYKYMQLADNKADVFINKFVEETQDEEGNKKYIYEFNSFRCDSTKITEEMIAENPFKYLDFSPEVKTPEEAIKELKNEIEKLKNKIEESDNK